VVEAGPQLEQRRHAPLTRTVPTWVQDAAMSLRSVLFPAPFGPMTPNVSPRRTSRFTFRSAQKSVNVIWPFTRRIV